MLSDEALVVEVRRLSFKGQRLPILLVLHHLSQPAKTGTITEKALSIGFRKVRDWNVTAILRAAADANLVAQLSNGWRLLPPGLESLTAVGVELDAPLISEVKHKLKNHLLQVADNDRRRFLDEVISAFDAKAYRAAIIMAWVGAAHILQEHVTTNHLSAFNAAGMARFPKDFRLVRSLGDFGRIKEADFLQLCEDASVMGKAEKQEMIERLGQRNRCGHPNALKFLEHTVASHIEILTSSVYAKY